MPDFSSMFPQTAASAVSAPSSPEEALAAAVAAGNVAQARALFDSSFWKDQRLVPAWSLAKQALLAENTGMLRLLLTHGTVATDQELSALRTQTRERYTRYVRLLRTAGMKLTPYQMKPYAALTDAQIVARIPDEWGKVCAALGPDAIIAGGALRDLANGAPVKDVDIFLPMPYFVVPDREGELSIMAAFDKLKLKIHEETVQRWHEYGLATSSGKVIMPAGWRTKRELPAPRRDSLRVAGQPDTTTFHHEAVLCWTLTAGPDKTEYNIIFVKTASKLCGAAFTQSVLDGFDIGLCQIAYDGVQLIRTKAYDRDAANAEITLVNPDDGTRKHLERIVKKYPDWKVCDAGRKLLATPLPQPKSRSRGTSDLGPR